jgi:hypothetical protein
MKYIKLTWFDFRQGLLKKPLLFAVPVVVALIACFDLTNRANGYISMQAFGITEPAGFGDYLMYIYGGMNKYDPSAGDPFVFPIRWAVVFLSVAFITLNYPYKDMQTFGQQILIRTRGRTAWWLSKCGWNIVCAAVYHALFFITVALFCVFTNASISIDINKDLIYAVFHTGTADIVANIGVVWPFFILIVPALVSLALNLFQMVLSLFIKPIFSFFVTAFLIISSAYYTSPFLIGNYAMPLRNDVVITDGVNWTVGIIVSIVLALAAVIAGSICFRKYDIINRD